jgi:ribonuclease D
LQEILAQRLSTLGRETWVAEECARIEEVRYTPPNIETAYLSVKGARDLDERGLAVLQSIFLFREEEARRQHRPLFFILPDATLVFLATSPDTTLAEVPGLGITGVKRFGYGLRQALRDGIAAPPVFQPPRIKAVRPTEKQIQRLDRLKEWRISLGSDLSLDPSLLWPLTSLKRLAKAPDTLGVELTSDNIRNWQRNVVASSLQACLDT